MKRFNPAILFVVCLLAFFSAQGQAQELRKVVAWQFKSAEQYQAFMDALKAKPTDIRTLRATVQSFKVPAVTKPTVRCEGQGMTRICSTYEKPERCPDTVEEKIEGTNHYVDVEVNCIGPDTRGECACEYAE